VRIAQGSKSALDGLNRGTGGRDELFLRRNGTVRDCPFVHKATHVESERFEHLSSSFSVPDGITAFDAR
jgi:hypothetical protein